jgi:hypothetical protein
MISKIESGGFRTSYGSFIEVAPIEVVLALLIGSNVALGPSLHCLNTWLERQSENDFRWLQIYFP